MYQYPPRRSLNSNAARALNAVAGLNVLQQILQSELAGSGCELAVCRFSRDYATVVCRPAKATLVSRRGCEFIDSWMEAERILVKPGEHGFSFSGFGEELTRQFKNVAAEEKERQRQFLRVESPSLDAIDRGMMESEKEHRINAVQQLRRSFLTGQSQFTSGTPAVQRARWQQKLFNLSPGR